LLVVSTTGNFSIQALKITNQTFTVRAGSYVSMVKVA
jgi:hypothetical protein